MDYDQEIVLFGQEIGRAFDRPKFFAVRLGEIAQRGPIEGRDGCDESREESATD